MNVPLVIVALLVGLGACIGAGLVLIANEIRVWRDARYGWQPGELLDLTSTEARAAWTDRS